MDSVETSGKRHEKALRVFSIPYRNFDILLKLPIISLNCRIMLERQHLTVKDYNKDQKAYASMLNKMYVAAKEGEWTGPVFYNS